MRNAPGKRWLKPGLGGVIVAVAVAGGALLLLGGPDGVPRGGSTPTAAPAPSASTAAVSAPASPSPSPSASPSSSPSPAASPSPSAFPQADSPLTDLAQLLPQRVAGFRRHSSARARHMARQPGAEQARRVRYVNDEDAEVTHVVGLFSGNRAAGAALRERRSRLLDRRGARVTDDTGLLDDDGKRRGRLIEVRRRNGDVVVLWRNRNLVGVLGPGRPRLHRRLYGAWPY